MNKFDVENIKFFNFEFDAEKYFFIGGKEDFLNLLGKHLRNNYSIGIHNDFFGFYDRRTSDDKFNPQFLKKVAPLEKPNLGISMTRNDDLKLGTFIFINKFGTVATLQFNLDEDPQLTAILDENLPSLLAKGNNEFKQLSHLSEETKYIYQVAQGHYDRFRVSGCEKPVIYLVDLQNLEGGRNYGKDLEIHLARDCVEEDFTNSECPVFKDSGNECLYNPYFGEFAQGWKTYGKQTLSISMARNEKLGIGCITWIRNSKQTVVGHFKLDSSQHYSKVFNRYLHRLEAAKSRTRSVSSDGYHSDFESDTESDLDDSRVNSHPEPEPVLRRCSITSEESGVGSLTEEHEGVTVENPTDESDDSEVDSYAPAMVNVEAARISAEASPFSKSNLAQLAKEGILDGVYAGFRERVKTVIYNFRPVRRLMNV
eukprot:GHVP01011703.1.p1 GENE.GHVP01011703.1~~GHVP01011703.1.p1  ORF type:complete len:426 (+),score=59.00 GHVP01011703.1:2518-3795(+)